MRRHLPSLVFALLLASVPVHPHALEIQILRDASVDDATRALLDRFKSDRELAASGISAVETNLESDVNLRELLKGEQIRIALVSLDSLVTNGIVRNTALLSLLLQPSQFPRTRDLFGFQNAPLGEAILGEIGRDRNFIPIGYWNRGQTSILATRPLVAAKDFKGRSIRSTFSEAADVTTAQLGARAVRMNVSDTVNALMVGQFDAAEFSPAVASSLVTQGIAANSLATQYRPLVGFLVAGSQAWNSLSELQKSKIADAARAADKAAQQSALEAETNLEAAALSKGLAIVNLAQADALSFRRASQTVLTRQFNEQAIVALSGTRTTLNLLAAQQMARPREYFAMEVPIPGPVPILFITDRADEGGNILNYRFGSKEVSNVELLCGHIHYFMKSSPVGVNYTHAIGLRYEPEIGSDKCIKLVVDTLRGSGRSRVLLFIHGFNNTFNEAIRRAIGSASDIKYDGVVLVWSWPSEGRALSYMRDEDTARRTQRFVSPVVLALLEQPEVVRLDILAHSMGTRIALNMLDELRKAKATVKLGSVVLAAADESKTIFGDVIRDFVNNRTAIGRTRTLYTAKYDRALQLSSFLHETARAGQGGDSLLVLKGVDSVDATDVEAGFWRSFVTTSHAHVFDIPEAVTDLKNLLMDDKAADQRGLKRRQRGQFPFWTIQKRAY